MKANRLTVLAGVAAALCLSLATSSAQNNQDQNNPGNQNRQGRQNRSGGNPGGGPGNFDPAQMQQRMLDRYKTLLEVTDDAEWNIISPLVQKVMQDRFASMAGMGRGMMGGRQRGNSGGDNAATPPPGGGRTGMFGQAMPEADALQKAIEAKGSKAEIKAALDKYVAARKAKQADLEKAQEDLRKVLTSRQEAIATLNGLL